jgi:adenylylsulfate kinase
MSKNGIVLWFTGQPAAGKTSIVNELKIILQKDYDVEVLDGDEVRKWLSPEAGFSKEDRERHIKRVAYVSNILARNGIVVLVSLVSPYRSIREFARKLIGEKFHEIYVKCSLETCMKRDPKGHYKMALNNEIKNMTGLQDPYEEPIDPELIIDTEKNNIKESVNLIIKFLQNKKNDE